VRNWFSLLDANRTVLEHFRECGTGWQERIKRRLEEKAPGSRLNGSGRLSWLGLAEAKARKRAGLSVDSRRRPIRTISAASCRPSCRDQSRHEGTPGFLHPTVLPPHLSAAAATATTATGRC